MGNEKQRDEVLNGRNPKGDARLLADVNGADKKASPPEPVRVRIAPIRVRTGAARSGGMG